MQSGLQYFLNNTGMVEEQGCFANNSPQRPISVLIAQSACSHVPSRVSD